VTYVLVFVVGVNIGGVYAAWRLGGWSEVRRLARLVREGVPE
jgi:hypothetical protein